MESKTEEVRRLFTSEEAQRRILRQFKETVFRLTFPLELCILVFYISLIAPIAIIIRTTRFFLFGSVPGRTLVEELDFYLIRIAIRFISIPLLKLIGNQVFLHRCFSRVDSRVDEYARLLPRSSDWELVHYAAPRINSKKTVTMLYFHGGGYCILNATSFGRFLVQLIDAFNSENDDYQLEIYSLEYHLASEPKWQPNRPLEQAHEAYGFLLNELMVCHNQIVLAGDSAGGNLAISLMNTLDRYNYPPPRGSLLISPWIDLTINGSPSKHDMLDVFTTRRIRQHITSGEDVESLVYCNLNPVGLPPSMVLVGELEILSDSIIAFAKKMENVDLFVKKHGVHDWVLYDCLRNPTQAEQDLLKVVRWMKRTLPSHKCSETPLEMRMDSHMN